MKGFTKEWGIRLVVIFLAGLWLFLLASSWAEAADSSEEYSFKWLDPDKKIYVLQNRKYTKAKRVLISAMAGQSFSNPYRSTYNLDPRISFYPAESWGVEVFYTLSSNVSNSNYTALRASNPNTWPSVREIGSSMGAMLHWVPWYAKINVFNQILYFDWYFAAGAGVLQAKLHTVNDAITNETLSAFYLGTGHQYYLSRDWTVRLDFTSTIYSAQVGITDEKSIYSNLNFAFGLGYRI